MFPVALPSTALARNVYLRQHVWGLLLRGCCGCRGTNDRKAIAEHEGRGETAQFDRDYASTARENSALHRNLKDAEAKEVQIKEVTRKQELKMSHLQEDIDNCGREYAVVVALRKGAKEQEELKKKEAKADHDLDAIKHSKKTEGKKLKKERKKEDEEVAALVKEGALLRTATFSLSFWLTFWVTSELTFGQNGVF